MQRRDFITLLGGTAAALPAMSRAQEATPTIGFLSTRSPDEAAAHTDAFRRGLEGMGYIEGRGVAIEYRWAEGDYSRLPSFAADLLSRPLALIVTPGDPAALAVKAAGLRIPDVFIVGQDPVRAGLVKSMNRPGMATGVNFFTGDLGGKRLELLCSMAPSVQVAGLLLRSLRSGFSRQLMPPLDVALAAVDFTGADFTEDSAAAVGAVVVGVVLRSARSV